MGADSNPRGTIEWANPLSPRAHTGVGGGEYMMASLFFCVFISTVISSRLFRLFWYIYMRMTGDFNRFCRSTKRHSFMSGIFHRIPVRRMGETLLKPVK